MSELQTSIVADCIISPIGVNTQETVRSCFDGLSGIKILDDERYDQKTTLSSFDQNRFEEDISPNLSITHTRAERLAIEAIRKMLACQEDLDLEKTGLVISTTKGNVDLLENNPLRLDLSRVYLHAFAKTIAESIGVRSTPVVISNACISGVSAIVMGRKLIRLGQFESVIVCGVDVLSDFIISGFHAFKAISPKPCRPYDADRDGISLGEGCGAILLRKGSHEHVSLKKSVRVLGGSSTNDANHISGPSRDGSGLALAVSKALESAELTSDDIDYISAHGTATRYNDDMESKAFTISGLYNTPLNSLKGYFGHTLGAAGVIESILGYNQMSAKKILPTHGLENIGTEKPIKALSRSLELEWSKYFLKTISGFGGFNGVAVFEIK